MMFGYLLARAGVKVLVLEKHPDFLRDFRGDTLHPSTLEVMHELGLLGELLALPHSEIRHLNAMVGDLTVTIGDFGHLPTRCKFIAMMPQWDFLNFLADKAAAYPTFALRMEAEVTGLEYDHDRIVGVRANTPDGELVVDADLVVGCDGRNSMVRQRAGFAVREFGAPMDVLWFRLSRQRSDPEGAFLRVDAGRFFVLINRPQHWQCGCVIRKGGLEELRARGLARFQQDIAQTVPFLADRVEEITAWDAVALLSVRVNRLKCWHHPGLLCIGDAAHAMSPVGGVGINLAIQDAIAAANLLTEPLRHGTVGMKQLRRVQRRRQWPTRATQAAQVLIGNRGLKPIVSGPGGRGLERTVRLLRRLPVLSRMVGRFVGLGVRPEHVTVAGI
jgi:2-polyprenyl-6-methoxyphenol hydroxylase-like FAD-dependent oxidoreductase